MLFLEVSSEKDSRSSLDRSARGCGRIRFGIARVPVSWPRVPLSRCRSFVSGLLLRAAGANRRGAAGVRGSEPHRRRSGARASRRETRLRARNRLERQGSWTTHDRRYRLPNRLPNEGDHERRAPIACRRGQDWPERSGGPLRPVLRQDDGGGQKRDRRDVRPGKTQHHHSRSAARIRPASRMEPRPT